ncbi:hypothetical protein K435DRAFT_961896 [Dendrothele bispora CBS 962.96]|uniref:Uncharacterized protein n=1 Tax=Dendrothele bispora (strain CBS 962.96) TaxID=1314807 RepID=A0A4S8MNV7_DENBC|nr:hypothetical protein K435DRAFT_961896 [Dendrothele bispora CBS 962.96]
MQDSQPEAKSSHLATHENGDQPAVPVSPEVIWPTPGQHADSTAEQVEDDSSRAANDHRSKENVPLLPVDHVQKSKETNSFTQLDEVSVELHHGCDPGPILPPRLLGRKPRLLSVSKMLGYMFSALLLAVGHDLYYKSLDKTSSDTTSSIGSFTYSAQAKERFITDIFTFLTRLLFGLSITTAFEQRLWYSLARKSVVLDGLDTLFGIAHDPLLFRKVIYAAKFKTTCILAVLAWTVSYGVIPVPGAISIEPLQSLSVANVIVSTVNLTEPPATGFVYKQDGLGMYSGPSLASTRLAGQTMTSGRIPEWSSPCGANCSYTLEFSAPSFVCQDPNTSEISSVVPSWQADSTSAPDRDTLLLRWMSELDRKLSNTTCLAVNSTYNVFIAYRNNERTININRIQMQGDLGTGGTINTFESENRELVQMAAMKDSLETHLLGSIFEDIQSGISTNQTLVAYSPLLLDEQDGPNGQPVFKPDSGKLVEEMMSNVSIGFMSLNVWNTTVDATVVSVQNVFFYDSGVLWAGYGASFGVTFVAVIVGLHAVWRNGGSGGTSFSLLVGTTRNPDLDDMVQQALTSDEGAKGLKKIALQYKGGPDGYLAFRRSWKQPVQATVSRRQTA